PLTHPRGAGDDSRYTDAAPDRSHDEAAPLAPRPPPRRLHAGEAQRAPRRGGEERPARLRFRHRRPARAHSRLHPRGLPRGGPRSHHEKLARLAAEHGFLLVCDEPYADLYVGMPPHSALQAARKNVLAIHSLSKRSGMTGYRSGFMAGDPELIATLRDVRANF